MSQHLDVTVPIIMASLLLGWTWLAERWQRYHRSRLPTRTHTDRALNRTILTPARVSPVRAGSRREPPDSPPADSA